jgi:hypothetical protein
MSYFSRNAPRISQNDEISARCNPISIHAHSITEVKAMIRKQDQCIVQVLLHVTGLGTPSKQLDDGQLLLDCGTIG